jgi:hypothetical protein
MVCKEDLEIFDWQLVQLFISHARDLQRALESSKKKKTMKKYISPADG